MSIKKLLKNTAVKGINSIGINSKYIGSPKRLMTVKEWIEKFGVKYGGSYTQLMEGRTVTEKPPVTLEQDVHKMYKNEYTREQPVTFVANIPNGRVWGRNGTVIAPNDVLITDVSREFGAYGGVTGKNHSVNKQLYLSKCNRVDGNIAIVGSAGAYNYHHWLYDTVSRIGLLKMAGVYDTIDKFILDYTGKHFQKETLKVLGIPEEKIILANDTLKFHVEAENLVIPSLPARLGTINKWTVDFLRDLFLKDTTKPAQRLYISRRKAPTRKVVNEDEVMAYLKPKGFIEFFPEDYSITETASYFSSADYIIGVHGSGFANLAFSSKGSKVIDIVAPKHLDPYYWMLCNHTDSTYAYLFGVGERPDEHADLVISKIDEDIVVDVEQLNKLFLLLEQQS